jgi:hypothetical protein
MATRPVRPQFKETEDVRPNSGEPAIQDNLALEEIDLAAEKAGFTQESPAEPWVLTAADAHAVIDSWNSLREPGEALKAALRHYVESVRQA